MYNAHHYAGPAVSRHHAITINSVGQAKMVRIV